MELSWMKQYRTLVEKFIRYANTYTMMFNKQAHYGTSILISASQIQTLEYVMENENMKMSQIARKLGITRGTFSKNVKKLEDKNLLKKYRRSDNQKDIYLFATDLGKSVYQQYTGYIYHMWFEEMFSLADQVPKQYLGIFEEMLEGFSNAFISAGQIEDQLPIYLPLEDHRKDI